MATADTTAVTAAATTAQRAEGGLHRRALGVPDLVFFIVAASAPLTAVAGGQATTYLVTGNKGIPLLFVPLGVVLALFAVGYAAMSRHVADAGAFYTYVARGLGRMPGVAAAFVALVAYNAMQFGIYGLFGVAFGAFAADKLGITLDWYWWCLAAAAVIALLGVLRVDLNARVLAVILVLEVVAVVIFDVAVVADPGPQGLSGAGFDPGNATGSALGAALVFGVASFVGFESAAIYSEECKDPKRTVARATFIAVAVVAVFYALSSWLLANAVGPDTMVDPQALVAGGFTTADGAAPDPTTVLIGSGTERLGAVWGDVASLLFATSLFAALLSFHNAVARYGFALGREGVFPRAFARVSPRTGAPVTASVVQTVLAVVVVGVFALLGKDPVLTLFTWLTNLGALGVVALMALTSFAVVAFFRRRETPDGGPWRTVVAPVLAGLALLAILVLGVVNFNVLITGATDAPLDAMSVVLPLLLLAAGALGVAVAAILRRRSPARYAAIGQPTRTEQVEHIS
ncbi:APC family permease [Patulibacter sp. SYSU D01012]|uniref:APC family permease n=1 Tax=Patulibacter sp. SYSU D01012 TaxID=2817381 RepID=UPI001B318486|nr:APC family permease [Patulibacter sp. SYSU D01012]